MFSIFSRFQPISHAFLLAMKRIVLVQKRVEHAEIVGADAMLPVSVSSTIPSSRRALISVVPQENSTVTLTPFVVEVSAGDVHKLGGDDSAAEIFRLFRTVLSSGTQSTHCAGLPVARQ